MDYDARTATVVLCGPGGEVFGALPPISLEDHWWPGADVAVTAVQERFGIEVVILRLLAVDGDDAYAATQATYLAQIDARPEIELAPVPAFSEHPWCQPWALPGGPQDDVAWAVAELEAAGTPVAGRPEQIRSWHLSSIWRLPVATGAVWLKVVPPFLSHEGATLMELQSFPVPRLLASNGSRVLLAEVPGTDQEEPTRALVEAMVRLLVAIQAEWAGRIRELSALGLPDWRRRPVSEQGRVVFERVADRLDRNDLPALDRFFGALDQRWTQIERCGIPDSLVHGDFHSGNLRWDGTDLTLLDWGDSGIGHPMLDQAAFLKSLIEPHQVVAAGRVWTDAWQRMVPGSDPARAATLLAPIGALRQALIYQNFEDNIEPVERLYHHNEPVLWLTRLAAAVRSERS